MKLSSLLDMNQKVIILLTDYENDFTRVIYPSGMSLEDAIAELQNSNIKLALLNGDNGHMVLDMYGDNVIRLADSYKAIIIAVIRK